MLIKTFKIASNTYVALLLCMIILTASCTKTEIKKINASDKNATTNNTTAAREGGYTGKEIFEGVFFAEGEIVEHLDVIKYMTRNNSTDTSVLSQKRIIMDTIEMAIERYNPNYFDNLKSNLEAAAIDDYHNILNDAAVDIILGLLKTPAYTEVMSNQIGLDTSSTDFIEIVSGNNKDMLKIYIANSNPNPTELCVALFVGVVVAVIVWEAAAAVNVVVVATICLKAWAMDLPYTTTDDDPDMTQEAAIAELYTVINN